MEAEVILRQRRHLWSPIRAVRADPHGRARRGLRLACAMLVCVAGLYVGYLWMTRTVLPRRLKQEFGRLGAEVTFHSLQASRPGHIVLQAPVLRGPEIWEVRAERASLKLRSYLPFGEDARVERIYATDVHVRVHGGAPIGPFDIKVDVPSPTHEGRLSVVANDVSGRIGAWSVHIDAHASAHIEPWDGVRDIEFENGSITLFALDVAALASQPGEGAAAREPPGATPAERAFSSSAHLDVQSASLSAADGVSLSGELSLVGDDAGLWLELADAGGALRWMLSDIVGKRFEARGDVELGSGRLQISPLEIELGEMVARGALHGDGDTLHGALLVRRGHAAIGITISEAGVVARMAPHPGWLSAELEELALQSSRPR